MIPLDDRLVEVVVNLQTGQSDSLLSPLIVGGDCTIENTVVLPIFEHYGVYGSYHEQLRGVADGTKVVIKVVRPPASAGCPGWDERRHQGREATSLPVTRRMFRLEEAMSVNLSG